MRTESTTLSLIAVAVIGIVSVILFVLFRWSGQLGDAIGSTLKWAGAVQKGVSDTFGGIAKWSGDTQAGLAKLSGDIQYRLGIYQPPPKESLTKADLVEKYQTENVYQQGTGWVVQPSGKLSPEDEFGIA